MIFKKLRLHTQLIVIVASVCMLLLFSIFATSNFFVSNLNHKLQQDFYNEVNGNLASIILSNSDRLGSLAMSHAYWTELSEATYRKDRDWTQINATKYLLLDQSFKIDELYLLNSSNGYSESYGNLPESVILDIHAQLSPAALSTKSTSYLVISGADIYIVSIAGLTDTSKDNLTGFYLLGQRFTKEAENLFIKQYANRADVHLSFTNNRNVRFVRIEPETLSKVLSNEIQLNISNIKLMNTITTHSKNLLYTVLATIFISALILLYSLLRLSSNFEESINRIKKITYHDYSQKIDLDFSKDFTELSQCINNLSAELSIRDNNIYTRYMELIAVLVKTLEEVDVYTKGHSERVSHYSVELAKAVGVEGEALEVIRLSGLLHDIGKITVDTKILNKPGKLDLDEFEEIKKHPLTAYNILGVSDVFLPIKDIVKSHHEKIDGSGYPEGLIGNQISLGAKIIAITDAFDSLTSERSYRKSMPLDEALSIIQNDAGTHFDPELTSVFITIAYTAYEAWSLLNAPPEIEELYLTQ